MIHAHRPSPHRRGVATAALWLVLAGFTAPAWATTYIVTHAGDDGPGSLRQAMTQAMASAEAGVIEFAGALDGIPIILDSPLPPITSNVDLTITGNGPGNTIIDGDNAHRPFLSEWPNNMALTLSDLTIRNGRAEEENGGAIDILGDASSVLTIKRVEFVGNSAGYEGGAIRTSIPTHIEDSVFENNEGHTFGGAITANSAPLTVLNSSFTGNSAPFSIIQFYGDIAPAVNGRLVNVTVTGNPSQHDTIDVNLNARLSLSNTVVAGNPTQSGGSLNMRNGGQVDAATSFNNLIGPAGDPGLVDGVNGNQLDVVDPLIGPLGNYGGPTRTLPLLPGSPAIDAGTSADDDIPALDQRGLDRVGAVDIGAFESRGFSLARVSGNGQSADVGTPFAQPLVVAVSANQAIEPVAGGQVQFNAPASGPSATLATPAASIDGDGHALTTATANLQAGGPYTVSASLPELTWISFALTNMAGPCTPFAFPYTLSGTDNAARVAELRQAIECANANTTTDEINLGGHTLLFTDAWQDGDNALPVVTAPLTLRNGGLERDHDAPQFRLLASSSTGTLALHGLQLHGGATAGDGGAIHAHGELLIRDSVLAGHSAGQAGGALAAEGGAQVITTQFADNRAGTEGAAIASRNQLIVLNARFEGHADASSRSLIWNDTYFAMIGSLLAGNQLSAAGSSLLAFTESTTVAEMRLVTIADNTVHGPLATRPDSYVLAYNAIIWGNSHTGLGISGRHNILQDHPETEDNRNLPPGFVGAGDYRLDAGSPAIDAGDSAYSMFDQWDLDGDGILDEIIPDLDLNPRAVEDPGVTDTSAGPLPYLDLGAFERQMPSPPAGITVAPTDGLVTGENGDEATFTVVLERYPAAPVSLALASSDPGEGLVAPTQLVFTRADWNQARTVTVIGIDDDQVDGDQAYTILIGPAVSDDPDYHGIDPDDVSVINLDDDVAGAWPIGGTVIGLAGSGLELALDIGDGPLAITGNGRFQFPGSHPAGTAYTVTVARQPQDPVQGCVVLNGHGSIGDGPVHSVVVNCGSGTAWSVGGSVTGLDGTVMLRLNGGSALPVSSTGGYAFPQRLADGASYVVSISQQPAQQLCTLDNASGVVAGADVDDVNVHCQGLFTDLSAALDDGGDHARYGRVRDYLVVVGNSGNAQAGAVQIAGQFSAAFDTPHVHWLCVDAGGGSCPASGSGGFVTSASIPAGASSTWIVSAPVRMDSAEAQATFQLGVTGPDGSASASDSNVLVLLRDGFNRPYGDGTHADPGSGSRSGPAPVPLSGADSIVIDIPAQATDGLSVLARLQLAQGQVQVQELALNGRRFLRLLATAADQPQRSSGFVPVVAGQRLAAGLVDTGDGVLVLLEGAGQALAVTLTTAPEMAPDTARTSTPDQEEGQ